MLLESLKMEYFQDLGSLQKRKKHVFTEIIQDKRLLGW